MIKQAHYFDKAIDWQAELITSDMFWCDLLAKDPTIEQNSQMSSLELAYLTRLETLLTRAFSDQCIYFLCRREKVRFDHGKMPRYNPITKKTKIYLLVGANKKRININVDLNNYFPTNKSNLKIKISNKFISFFKDEKDCITQSIHDFLSSMNIKLNIENEMIAIESTCSPCLNRAFPSYKILKDLINYSNETQDILLFVNRYDINFKIYYETLSPDVRLISNLSDPQDCIFLMLARCFTLYFFENDVLAIISVKNARKNLKKFLIKNNIHRIAIAHAYGHKNEYTSFSSEIISCLSDHIFKIENKKDEIFIYHENKKDKT